MTSTAKLSLMLLLPSKLRLAGTRRHCPLATDGAVTVVEASGAALGQGRTPSHT
jgi:hypothetical protein